MDRRLLLLPALALTVAGCGGGASHAAFSSTSSLSPHDALVAGAQRLQLGRDATVTVRLESSATALSALSHGHLSGTRAKALLDGSVTYALHAPQGHTLVGDLTSPTAALSHGDQESIVIDTGHGTKAELRAIDGALYGRADVKGFLSFKDDAKAAIAALGVGVPSRLRAVARAGIAGDWISISAADVKALQAKLAQSPDAGVGLAPFGPALPYAKIVGAITSAATVTRTSSSGADDHLQVSIGLQDLARVAEKAIASDLPDATFDEADGIPAQSETAEVTTHDGLLSEVRVDLAKDLGPDERTLLHGEPFALVLSISTSPVSVSKPGSSAAFVDPVAALPSLDPVVTRVHTSSSLDYGCAVSAGESPSPCTAPTNIPCPSDAPAKIQKQLCKDGYFVPTPPSQSP